MFDHINIPVSNLQMSVEFYKEALKPLDVPFLMFDEDAAGFGSSHWAFGIFAEIGDIVSLHVAFSAESKQVVDAFYKAAIEAGAADNGAPGLRPEYGATYYAAYVTDLDGHNIEAVCRCPIS